MPAALRVYDLWKSYAAGVAGCSARVWALRGCTLEVMVGERVAIVGTRGAGKTTLLNCLAGEQRRDAGRVDLLVPVRRTLAALDERISQPVLFLVDEFGESTSRSQELNLRRGDTLIVAARDVARVHGLVDRVVLLRDGRLAPLTRTVVRRVAERLVPDAAVRRDRIER
jgi:energy-coupling factor transporter ATP-binding protein EcfA2